MSVKINIFALIAKISICSNVSFDMTERKRKFIYYLLQTFIVAGLTWLLSMTVIDNFSSLTNFQLSIERKDYFMSDVYNTVANKRPVQTLSDNIVILGVDGCSRNDIANVLDSLALCRPSVVGVDIQFVWQYNDDDHLLSSLRQYDALVLPMQLSGLMDDGTFSESQTSYFTDSLNCNIGVVNLESTSIRQSIRSFRPYYQCLDEQLESFPFAIARLYDPNNASASGRRSNESETISYVSREFLELSAEDILVGGRELSNMIENRIVLIGDVNDVHDFHVTPIDEGMPGIKIHAYAIDTVLANLFVRNASAALNWFIAVLLSLIFISLNFLIMSHYSNVGNFLVRVVQVAFLYFLFLLGCRLFASKGIYVDFAPTFAMLSLSLFMYDVWLGIVGIIKYFYHRLHKS